MTGEDKKYILNQHLKNISHISDKEYQQRVWIKGEGPEVDDFDETVCYFFDLGDPILKKYKEYEINDDQYHLLIKFRTAFDAFVRGPRSYLSEEFINTPQWARIISLAKDVLRAFDFLIFEHKYDHKKRKNSEGNHKNHFRGQL